ncbi:hypothetical protein ACIQ7D_18135 [Streptomyces sp. NPDC096310]|uniref:hypothetical protein n=1 Tax=Streptomyces sp. NPDC096310 TaxID=3366082 RepID=UPI0038090585
MSIDFLPEEFSRATKTTVVVPVSGKDALADPPSGRVVIPARVEISLTLFEGTSRGDRAYAYVSVTGPRRLKSGAIGKPITSFGWEKARNDGRCGYAARPGRLTNLLDDYLPMGWDPALLDLTEGGAS